MNTLEPVLSVVVPAKNEEGNIFPLITEISAALQDKFPFEIIYVDDGSADATLDKLKEAKKTFPNLKFVSHDKSTGQSGAVMTGISLAKAPVIATLDGDGQNDPADIPHLYEVLMAQEDKEKVMIAGHRVNRKDTFSKRFFSKIANTVRKGILKDDTPDTGCGIKLFPKSAFDAMPKFDHMHRYLPALMKMQGGRIISVPVNHRPRASGVSNYGIWDRLWVGIFDLLGVMWLARRYKSAKVITYDN